MTRVFDGIYLPLLFLRPIEIRSRLGSLRSFKGQPVLARKHFGFHESLGCQVFPAADL
jgi:hypothetical protein